MGNKNKQRFDDAMEFQQFGTVIWREWNWWGTQRRERISQNSFGGGQKYSAVARCHRNKYKKYLNNVGSPTES